MARTSRTRPRGGRGRAGRRRSAAGERARPTLRILESRVLRGPNYWSPKPVIRMLVDLGDLERWPSNTIPHFTDALVGMMPTLDDHACSLGRRGGFVSRLRDGTWMGHVAEHVALELQNLAGTEVRHGKTRSAGAEGRYHVIYEYREEQVGLEAGRMAVRLVNHLVDPDDPEHAFDLEAEMEHLIRLAERLAFGPSTQALVDEAIARDIPVLRLDRYSLVQLGQGVHQQRIRATMTSKTSGIAVDIASDKSLTNQLLSAAGLPVPRAEVVETEDEAVAAAERLGYPVVVKPLDGNHGRGVGLNLRDADAVRGHFAEAKRQSRGGDVVVESFITGNDYRVLIVGGKLAAVAERVPASVTGDGEHTIRQLVEIANSDPRRGIGHEKVLTRIKVDAAAEAIVAEQGFGLDDVPPAGTLGQAGPDRQHVDRRDLDRPDHGGPPRQRRDRRDGGPRRRPRHRRDRLHLPRHRRARPRDRRRDRGGQRGARASGCTPTRPRASRSTWRSRSWTSSSRPAPRPGSRSWPSRARTARRRRSG